MSMDISIMMKKIIEHVKILNTDLQCTRMLGSEKVLKNI
jgi:hypothetical protein